MKKIIFGMTFMLFNSFEAHAAHQLKLSTFDQAKLGELLNRLPDHLVRRTYHNVRHNPSLRIQTLTLINEKDSYQMSCERIFYPKAVYPSQTTCAVRINLDNPATVKRHDVLRITERDPTLVSALKEAIPYGSPQKKFYSYQRDEGITFTGGKGTVFHYQFICAQSLCWLKFSRLIMQEEPST
jgi:hypothetical protein